MTDRWVDLPAPFVIVLQSQQHSTYTRERQTHTADDGHQLRRNGFVVVPLPRLSTRQTLCGVRHPQNAGRQAGRQAGTRPAAPLSPCDSIPCFHLLLSSSNAFIPTHYLQQNKWKRLQKPSKKDLQFASLACRGRRSEDLAHQNHTPRPAGNTQIHWRRKRFISSPLCLSPFMQHPAADIHPCRRPPPETTTNTHAGTTHPNTQHTHTQTPPPSLSKTHATQPSPKALCLSPRSCATYCDQE